METAEATKLFVGNLPFSTTDEELKTLFAQAGTVTDVRLIHDRETGRAKGFAFVSFADADMAKQAITNFNGYEFQGRPLRVDHAVPSNGGRSGGGRGGRGGSGDRHRR